MAEMTTMCGWMRAFIVAYHALFYQVGFSSLATYLSAVMSYPVVGREICIMYLYVFCALSGPENGNWYEHGSQADVISNNEALALHLIF